MFPILRLRLAEFNPRAALYCGQAFRWRPGSDGHESIVDGRLLRVEERDDTAVVLGCDARDADVARRLIDPSLSLRTVARGLAGDDLLREAARESPGLRILRQAPWETLASFILSSTKNIPHIAQLVEALCDAAGPAVEGASRRAFPGPEIVAAMSEQALRQLGMGFRAPYLRETARRVASGSMDLEALADLPTETARCRLIDLPGVGPKIADCVLLFAYGRQDSFPLDVWVSRVLVHHYLRGRRRSAPRLRAYALRRFGPWAGYAQQHIFHYARSHPERFRPPRAAPL